MIILFDFGMASTDVVKIVLFLFIGSTPELNGLVEDKEVAARAVAFVVNSTRKGIVPLCADIANLLRAKRRLSYNLCGTI